MVLGGLGEEVPGDKAGEIGRRAREGHAEARVARGKPWGMTNDLER